MKNITIKQEENKHIFSIQTKNKNRESVDTIVLEDKEELTKVVKAHLNALKSKINNINDTIKNISKLVENKENLEKEFNIVLNKLKEYENGE